MALSEIYDYFRSYDKRSFAVFAQQGSEPTGAVVAAFEQTIGFDLPDEFREFAIHALGGLYMEVHEELWPRPQLYAVGPFWSFLYGLQVYSLSPGAPDWLRIEHAWNEMADQGYPKLVPFLRIIGDADPYCFTEKQKIVIWRHEEPDNPKPVQHTFSECVMAEIRELENRKNRKVAGEA
jgi:hypothetical protein